MRPAAPLGGVLGRREEAAKWRRNLRSERFRPHPGSSCRISALPAACRPLPAASLHPGDGSVLRCGNCSLLLAPRSDTRRPAPPASAQALRECPVGVPRGLGRERGRGAGLWPQGWRQARTPLLAWGLRAGGFPCARTYLHSSLMWLCGKYMLVWKHCPKRQRYLDCKSRQVQACSGEPGNS